MPSNAGVMPALAAADMVEPEGGVRLVRGDDAPDRGRPGEVVHEPGEPQDKGKTAGDEKDNQVAHGDVAVANKRLVSGSGHDVV